MAFKPSPEQYLEVTSKLAFLFYWLFDNSSLLSKLKILNFDFKLHNKYASLAWFIGSFFGLIKSIYDLVETLKEKEKQGKVNNPAIEKKLINIYLNIFMRIGDLLPSAQGAELPQMIFGRQLNETLVGFGGFVSGFIGLRNCLK